MRRPEKVMAPAVGVTIPMIVLHSVDLPMPLRPTMHTASVPMEKVRPSSTRDVP